MLDEEPLKSRKRHVGGLGSQGFGDDQQKRAKHQQRSGKWTAEEESFANQLVLEFGRGTLEDCDDGCTLRSYLAKKLNCAPMRISKKFAGQCIGKLVFKSEVQRTHEDGYEKLHLHQLEGLYKLSCSSDESTKPSTKRSGDSSKGKPAGGTRSQYLHKLRQHQNNMLFPAGGSDSRELEIYVDMPQSISSVSTESGNSSSEDDDLSLSSATASPIPQHYYITSSSSGVHGGFNAFMGSNNFSANSRPSATDWTSLLDDSVDNDGGESILESVCKHGPIDDSRVSVEADEWRDVLSFFCGEDEFVRDPNIFDPRTTDSSPSNGYTSTSMVETITPVVDPSAVINATMTTAK